MARLDRAIRRSGALDRFRLRASHSPPVEPRVTKRTGRAAMIPGEIIPAAGDIELNAGRPTVTLDGRQHRRPADPGRLALPFLRDQRGAAVRPRARRAACGSTSRPAPRCASSRARRARCTLVAYAGGRGRLRLQRRRSSASWSSSSRWPSACRASAYAAHVRPDDRRPGAARRHRAGHRGRGGPHGLRRGGQVRRRQGDPRRHGPEPGARAPRARSTPSSPTR